MPPPKKITKITKKIEKESKEAQAAGKADTQSSDRLSALSKVGLQAFCDVSRACIGTEDLESISALTRAPSTNISEGSYDAATDDIDTCYDDQGVRKVPRKTNKDATDAKKKDASKSKSKKSQDKGGNERCGGWCTFPIIMISSMVLLFAFLAYLKVSEETFGVRQNFEEIDYYAILDIPKTATYDEIKRSYRKLTIKWHPDRNPNCGDECVQKMGQINEAFVVLGNPETKAFHDQHGVKPPESMISLAKAKHGGHAKKDRRGWKHQQL